MTPQSSTSSNALSQSPAAGDAPVPIWLMVLLGVMMYVASLYLDEHGGGFHPQVPEPFTSYKSLVALQPKTAGGESAAKGKKVYDNFCAPCHLFEGTGNPGNQIPPLAGSEWVTTAGPNRVIRLILSGLQGPIEVKGQKFNGAMPEWKGTLSDEDVAAVATFIRQNKDWGHAASAVKSEQVKELRGIDAARSSSWMAADLEQTPDQ